jgi:hypothetical protein
MIKRLLSFLRLNVIFPIPGGIVADKVGMWGLMGLMSQVNNYAESLTASISTATAPTLTTAQLLAGFTQLGTGAGGGYNVTLPSTSSIIAALGPACPTDGSFSMPVHIMNNNSGQTATLVAGDGSTTITGTGTIATNITRKYILNVASATTITLTNVGTLTV